MSVGEVIREMEADGRQVPHLYANNKKRWWRWRVLTGHHNDDGYVPREEVIKVIGGHPNLPGLGGGSGVKELTYKEYDRLLFLFKQNRHAVPLPEKPKHRCGGGGESDDHKQLKHYVADHPEHALCEAGLRKVDVEYPFCTGDRIDVLLEDNLGRPVAVEIELSQSASQKEGFMQAIKYRALICAHWGRKLDGGRAMLVAHELAPEIIELCKREGVEWHVIPRTELT